jgi:hypothetical protein
MSSSPSSQENKLRPDRSTATTNRKMEPTMKHSQQPQQTAGIDPYNEASLPEGSHPPGAPVRGSSTTDRRRAQPGNQHQGVDMLRRGPPDANRTNSERTNSGYERPPQEKPSQPREREGMQPTGNVSLERSESRDHLDARRGGQPARPTQPSRKENSRLDPLQSRDATQTPPKRPNGQGSGSNEREANRCNAETCIYYRTLAQVQGMVDERLGHQNTNPPRRLAGREPINRRNREQGSEPGSRQDNKDHKLLTGKPMTLQGRQVPERSASEVPMAQPGMQAAPRAMGNNRGQIAPERPAERHGGGSSQSTTQRPAASSRSRAPPRRSTDKTDTSDLD